MAKEDQKLSYEEKESRVSAADTLLMQIGSNQEDLADGKVNMARMGVIQDSVNVPESFRNWVYWDLCAKLLGDEFAEAMHDIGLDHTVGIGGRGRIDAIKAASVALGGQANTEADIIKPHWVTRNILDKDWEAKERARLGLQPGE